MTTVWTLAPNQYERTIYLVLSEEPFYDIITLLNEKYNFGWEESVDFAKDDDFSAPCTITNDEKFKIAVILNNFDGSIKCFSSLVHELYHVMTHISERTGAKMNDETTEHWAYFLSFYTDMCLQVLDEHSKSKNINNFSNENV